MNWLHGIGLGAVLIGTFIASSVEMTEMVIIVVGVGATRGWRSTMIGAGAGLVILVGIVLGLGQALQLIPIGLVRIVIGGLLLTFGLQWYRQGVIGVAARGFTGGRGEEVDGGGDASHGAVDWTAFVLSFKGVLLEGLEIAFIVVAFGAGGGSGGSYKSAYVGALAAFVLIGALGLAAKSRLERVPGRTLKFGVGGLLSTFGTFWTLEGLGVQWPSGDLSLAWLYALYLLCTFTLMYAARAGLIGPPPGRKGTDAGPAGPTGLAPTDAGSIRDFQSAHGLRADGVIGPRTQAAVRSVRGELGVSRDGVPRVGVDFADADAVAALQRRLQLAVSGEVDAATRGALRVLQRAGLLDPTQTDRIRAFQLEHELAPTGDIDEPTGVAIGAVVGDSRRGEGTYLDPVTCWQAVDVTDERSVCRFQWSVGLAADGVVGDETRGALLAMRTLLAVDVTDSSARRAVQDRHGLSVDSVVGPQTRNAIVQEQQQGPPADTRPVMTEPDTYDGDSVRTFQRHHDLPPDGAIGPQTRQAIRWEREHHLLVDVTEPASVREFQRVHGLAVDGIVGERTQAAMRAARAEREVDDPDQRERRYGPAGDRAGERVVDPTDSAQVRDFQRRHRLDDDGAVGPRTATALRTLRRSRAAGDGAAEPAPRLGHRLWQLVVGFGRFWYGFVIGDDWTVAAAVLVLIGGTYALMRLSIFAWWFGPLVVIGTAAFTVRRALNRAVSQTLC